MDIIFVVGTWLIFGVAGFLCSKASASPKKGDAVNHPSHYTDGKYEVIILTENMNFCLGNAIKYLSRAGKKDPTKTQEDIKKAVWYCNREILRVTNSTGGILNAPYNLPIDINDYCEDKKVTSNVAIAIKNIVLANRAETKKNYDKEKILEYLNNAVKALS